MKKTKSLPKPEYPHLTFKQFNELFVALFNKKTGIDSRNVQTFIDGVVSRIELSRVFYRSTMLHLSSGLEIEEKTLRDLIDYWLNLLLEREMITTIPALVIDEVGYIANYH